MRLTHIHGGLNHRDMPRSVGRIVGSKNARKRSHSLFRFSSRARRASRSTSGDGEARSPAIDLRRPRSPPRNEKPARAKRAYHAAAVAAENSTAAATAPPPQPFDKRRTPQRTRYRADTGAGRSITKKTPVPARRRRMYRILRRGGDRRYYSGAVYYYAGVVCTTRGRVNSG